MSSGRVGVESSKCQCVAYLANLQTPKKARPSEIPVMPSLRLLIPNKDLLAIIWALFLSSCEVPER